MPSFSGRRNGTPTAVGYRPSSGSALYGGGLVGSDRSGQPSAAHVRGMFAPGTSADTAMRALGLGSNDAFARHRTQPTSPDEQQRLSQRHAAEVEANQARGRQRAETISRMTRVPEGDEYRRMVMSGMTLSNEEMDQIRQRGAAQTAAQQPTPMRQTPQQPAPQPVRAPSPLLQAMTQGPQSQQQLPSFSFSGPQGQAGGAPDFASLLTMLLGMFGGGQQPNPGR